LQASKGNDALEAIEIPFANEILDHCWQLPGFEEVSLRDQTMKQNFSYRLRHLASQKMTLKISGLYSTSSASLCPTCVPSFMIGHHCQAPAWTLDIVCCPSRWRLASVGPLCLPFILLTKVTCLLWLERRNRLFNGMIVSRKNGCPRSLPWLQGNPAER
jgi:hypothetical protein